MASSVARQHDAQFDRFNASISAAVEAVRQASEAIAAQFTLEQAEDAAKDEAQRSYAMYGDYSQMAALVESHASDSRAALASTVELERRRRALFS